ncbi:unnamed protein product [Urochloa humidicola]
MAARPARPLLHRRTRPLRHCRRDRLRATAAAAARTAAGGERRRWEKDTTAGNTLLRGSDARFDKPGGSGAGSARRRVNGGERESWGGRHAAGGPSRVAAVPLGHPPPAPNKMRARSTAGGRAGPSTAMGILFLCPAARPGPPPEREGPAAPARLAVAATATKPEEGLRMEARAATDTAGCCYCSARHR